MSEIRKPSTILSPSPDLDGRGDWPEGAVYRYDRAGHEVLRVVRRADEELAAEVARGPVHLALLIDGPVLVLCSKVGERLPWLGASYHWHRVRRPDRILPPSGADTATGDRVDLKLMEAQGGRVHSVRPLVLPLDFTRALHEAILEQARFTYDPGAERRALEALHRRCPTPGILALAASVKARIAD